MPLSRSVLAIFAEKTRFCDAQRAHTQLDFVRNFAGKSSAARAALEGGSAREMRYFPRKTRGDFRAKRGAGAALMPHPVCP